MEVKEFLSFLCEQVYKGAITGTKYVSNSTRTQEWGVGILITKRKVETNTKKFLILFCAW